MLNLDFQKIRPYLYFLPALLLQLKFVPIIAMDGIVPDLAFIILVMYTLKNGRIWGLVAAAVFGFIYDMVSGNAAGSSMLAQSISIFVVGLFYREQISVRYLGNYYLPLIVFLTAVINSVLFTFITNYDASASLFTLLLRQGILPALYTAFLSGFVCIIYPRRLAI